MVATVEATTAQAEETAEAQAATDARAAAATELGLELISIGSDYDIRVMKEDSHER